MIDRVGPVNPIVSDYHYGVAADFQQWRELHNIDVKYIFIYNTTIPQDTNWSRSGLSGSGCYRSWIDCHTLCTIIRFKYTNESVS